MKIKRICGIYELMTDYKIDPFILNGPILSISCPKRPSKTNIDLPTRPEFLENKTSDILKLDFDDISQASFGDDSFILPSTKHIEEALSWAKDKEEILVHCHAGISRSTTMSYAVLLDDGYKPLQAAMGVYRLRKTAMFNTYMMGLISDVLGIKFEELAKAYREVFI